MTTVYVTKIQKNCDFRGVHKARQIAAKKLKSRTDHTGILAFNKAGTIVRLYAQNGHVLTAWYERPIDIADVSKMFERGLGITINLYELQLGKRNERGNQRKKDSLLPRA